MALTPEQHAAFDRWLKGRCRYPLLCGACFNEIAIAGDDIVTLPILEPNRTPQMNTLQGQMVRVVCPLCAHIMLFDATVLEWD